MIEASIQRLEYLCDIIPALLTSINEIDFSFKPAPEKWSKKEVLGHLIDSATNNHQRFVRGQFENAPAIFYDQNKWNSFSNYQNFDGALLISFWTNYNRYIAELIKKMPEENLAKECAGKENNVTIQWLFEDYVRHLEHHLKQIVDYK